MRNYDMPETQLLECRCCHGPMEITNEVIPIRPGQPDEWKVILIRCIQCQNTQMFSIALAFMVIFFSLYRSVELDYDGEIQRVSSGQGYFPHA